MGIIVEAASSSFNQTKVELKYEKLRVDRKRIDNF